MIATIRDISIIFLALESIVVLVLLSILIVQVRNLVVLLNEEIKPLLSATQETADTVRNTTSFMSRRVAKPAINALSFGAGVRQGVRTLKRSFSSGRDDKPPAATDFDAARQTQPSTGGHDG